jgi:hypothetical protein
MGTDATVDRDTFTECAVAGEDGYARQAIEFVAAGTDGVTVNDTGTLTFGPATTSWGMLKSWALFTAVTGGTRIIQGLLTDQTKTVAALDSVTVAAGAIEVTLTTAGSAISSTASGLILDHILGKTDWPFDTDSDIFLALGSDDAPDRTTFTEIVTAGTKGYARQVIVFDAATDDADNVVANATGTLTFGPCDTTNWGTIKSWAIYSTVTGGTRLLQGALTDPTKIVNIGDSATVAAGAVVVTAS